MLSSSSARRTCGAFISGRTSSTARIIPAKTRKTDCQGITPRSPSASGGPTTCPAEPAAVVMASAIERC